MIPRSGALLCIYSVYRFSDHTRDGEAARRVASKCGARQESRLHHRSPTLRCCSEAASSTQPSRCACELCSLQGGQAPGCI
jgi:hypothetical protein